MPWPRLSAQSKIQIQEPDIPFLAQVNSKYENHANGNAGYRGLDTPSLMYATSPSASGNPL
jgi:hypothetical protein